MNPEPDPKSQPDSKPASNPYQRPTRLPLAHRLRSNLFKAPPFLAGTVLFGSASLIASTWDKPGHRQHRLARLWAKASLRAAGARLQVIGIENIPRAESPDAPSLPQQGWETVGATPLASAVWDPAQSPPQTAVYAANHTSYMDTPVVFASLPFQFRILAKKELWTMPFIGWYLHRSGQIPINTENPRATVSSLGAAVKTLRQGLSIFVFPEGGRTPDGNLQPFMNGAAYLAIRAQVPLIPVALIGVYNLLPIHTRHFFLAPKRHRTPLKFVIGSPIPTEGLTIRNADDLTTQLRQTIADLIQQHG